MYLVDTNIVSTSAPHQRAAHELTRWLDVQERLYISVITVTELEDGLAKLHRTGATAKARRLGDWLESILHLYAGRILGLDLGTARLAGQLSDRARRTGQQPGLADILIAATAAYHNLTLLTRNTRHFAPLGIRTINPYT